LTLKMQNTEGKGITDVRTRRGDTETAMTFAHLGPTWDACFHPNNRCVSEKVCILMDRLGTCLCLFSTWSETVLNIAFRKSRPVNVFVYPPIRRTTYILLVTPAIHVD
jgi:hypothetical protein